MLKNAKKVKCDGQTDSLTDGPTHGPTNTVTYRAAYTRLKTWSDVNESNGIQTSDPFCRAARVFVSA